MNRQTKRMMKRQGQAVEGDAPVAAEPRRRPPTAPARRERTTPSEYVREVRAEMRKVAWPGRAEVVNSTIIVLVAVTVMTTLIFAIDYGSAKVVLFLFNQ